MQCWSSDYTRAYDLLDTTGNGGEGTVYQVKGQPALVAKIYSPQSLERRYPDASGQYTWTMQEKVSYMASIAPSLPIMVDEGGDEVLSVAWPQVPLFDANNNFVGFLMPRVKPATDGDGIIPDLHFAYRKRERKYLFGEGYSWLTSIRIARNLSTVVRNLHEHDVVIGDFNCNNILIDGQGHVTLIDADSFCIRNDLRDITYKCVVGVGEFVAPEMQGLDFSESRSRRTFTKETDCFSLAVHVFMLLMNGTHPFSGTQVGQDSKKSSSAEPYVAEIASGACPFVTGSPLVPFGNTPKMSTLPYEMREMFDRAFGYASPDGSIKEESIARRPTAAEWEAALDDLLELCEDHAMICPVDGNHINPPSNETCMWCEIEGRLTRLVPRFGTPAPPSRPRREQTTERQEPVSQQGIVPVVDATARLVASVDGGRRTQDVSEARVVMSPASKIPTLVEIPMPEVEFVPVWRNADGQPQIATDAYGRPIRETDEYGNALQAVDSNGNPLYDGDGKPVPQLRYVVPAYAACISEGDVARAVSKQALVYSADGHVVYRGPLSTAMPLDTGQLCSVLCGQAPVESDIQAEVATYIEAVGGIRANDADVIRRFNDAQPEGRGAWGRNTKLRRNAGAKQHDLWSPAMEIAQPLVLPSVRRRATAHPWKSAMLSVLKWLGCVIGLFALFSNEARFLGMMTYSEYHRLMGYILLAFLVFAVYSFVRWMRTKLTTINEVDDIACTVKTLDTGEERRCRSRLVISRGQKLFLLAEDADDDATQRRLIAMAYHPDGIPEEQGDAPVPVPCVRPIEKGVTFRMLARVAGRRLPKKEDTDICG